MRALVLNGSRDDALDGRHDTLVRELVGAGWDTLSLKLREMRIAHCLGCFQCWTKTPGVCRMSDDGREVVRWIMASDLAVLYTPVTFGGYSSELKKALDRSICILSPFFMKIDGEYRHRPRYERYPALLGVGVLPEPDAESEAIFSLLLARNALNVHAPAHGAGFVYHCEDESATRRRIDSLLTALGVWT